MLLHKLRMSISDSTPSASAVLKRENEALQCILQEQKTGHKNIQIYEILISETFKKGFSNNSSEQSVITRS